MPKNIPKHPNMRPRTVTMPITEYDRMLKHGVDGPVLERLSISNCLPDTDIVAGRVSGRVWEVTRQGNTVTLVRQHVMREELT